jgi:hypothetical protein
MRDDLSGAFVGDDATKCAIEQGQCLESLAQIVARHGEETGLCLGALSVCHVADD